MRRTPKASEPAPARPGAPSVYETWVVRLRAWATDPRTSLTDLPPLSVESLPPDSFYRLFRHVTAAIDQMMQGWSSELERSLRAATSAHERRVALVGARRTLAHRLELAGHPGLPQEVREQLLQGAEDEIRALQQQLEDNVQRGQTGASFTWDYEEELKLVQECALTAILDPQWQATAQPSPNTAGQPGAFGMPAVRTVAASQPSTPALPPLMGSVRRRIIT